MSMDFGVYPRRQQPVTPAEIVSGLRARGIEAVWESSRPREPDRASGHLRAADARQPSPAVDLSTEPLDPAHRQSLIESYSSVLTPAQTKALSAATAEQMVSAPWSQPVSASPFLAHLIDLLAELGDGLIIDMQTNETYDRSDFRKLNAAALGT